MSKGNGAGQTDKGNWHWQIVPMTDCQIDVYRPVGLWIHSTSDNGVSKLRTQNIVLFPRLRKQFTNIIMSLLNHGCSSNAKLHYSKPKTISICLRVCNGVPTSCILVSFAHYYISVLLMNSDEVWQISLTVLSLLLRLDVGKQEAHSMVVNWAK